MLGFRVEGSALLVSVLPRRHCVGECKGDESQYLREVKRLIAATCRLDAFRRTQRRLLKKESAILEEACPEQSSRALSS